MSLWAPAHDKNNPQGTAAATMKLAKWQLGLPLRFAIVSLVFIVEKIALTAFVNHDGAQAAQGFGATVRNAQHWGFRFLVALVAAVAVFEIVRDRRQWDPAVGDKSVVIPIRLRWAQVHILLVAVLAPLSYLLFRDGERHIPLAALASLWVILGAAAALAAFAAMAPLSLWRRAAGNLGVIWLYAIGTALISASAMSLSDHYWTSASLLTFDLVRLVLAPILPHLHGDIATQVLSTDRFAVLISEYCSGLEGISLMLAFCSAWLFYFRREYIFPRALLLIPVGVVVVYALNVLRIAALMLIGHAGFERIAVYGFHSQAGWIAFNVAACSLVYFSRRSTYLTTPKSGVTASEDTANPTAAYLMPLLAVLIAGTISHVFSSGFDRLYPLRLAVGLAVIALYWRKLATRDWHWSWRGPLVGALVFVLWLAAAQFLLVRAAIPDELAAMPGMLRGFWIVSRMATAILIVPIVEELAYRGFLMRRVMSKDFESVSYRSVNGLALSVAAAAFALPHAAMWMPAAAAGFAYGLVARRSGSIGDAIAAHMTTNLLLAIAVLGWSQWQMW